MEFISETFHNCEGAPKEESDLEEGLGRLERAGKAVLFLRRVQLEVLMDAANC